MEGLEDIVQFKEFIKRSNKVGRRYLRDYSDPFRKYDIKEFYSRYNLSPQTVKDVLVPMLEPYLKKPSRRGLPFPPEIMVLVTLRYYATGGLQLMDDVANICQQSMSRIVCSVSRLLARQMKNLVKFPTLPNINDTKMKFFGIARFPEAIGCINCTHIKVKNPGGSTADVFKNKKGWYSIKVQAVVGPDMKFYDLVVRWPGSYNDNFIFHNSTIKQRLLNNELPGVLLGHIGYTLSPTLMTPYAAPINTVQSRYNESHIKTWNVVKQALFSWKSRFHCLQVGMAVKLDTAVAVVCACALLHNMAVQYEGLTMDHNLHRDDNEPDDIEFDIMEDHEIADYLARENFVLKYFSE